MHLSKGVTPCKDAAENFFSLSTTKICREWKNLLQEQKIRMQKIPPYWKLTHFKNQITPSLRGLMAGNSSLEHGLL
jgi:hypothetical protein